jgi:SAM-dependent methyltransferase
MLVTSATKGTLESLFQTTDPMMLFGAVNNLYDAAPELYDRLYGKHRHDIQFWTELGLEARGAVLEIGSGTGRVTAPMASAGIDITGVDRSFPMLSMARSKQANLRLVQEDIRCVELKRRFQLVIAPANVINECFAETDIDLWLDGVRRHLVREGELVVAARNLIQETQQVRKVLNLDPSIGIVEWTTLPYDHRRQLSLATITHKEMDTGTERMYFNAHRIYFPAELEAALYRHGFHIHKRLGDYAGASFDENSPTQLVQCKLR